MATDSTAPTGPLALTCEKCGSSAGEVVAIYPGESGGYIRYMHKRCYDRWMRGVIFLAVAAVLGFVVFITLLMERSK